jgi:outer membrane protein insertion porin family
MIVTNGILPMKWSRRFMMKKTCRLILLFVCATLLSATGRAAVVIDNIRIENLEKVELDSSFVQAYTSLRAGQEIESEAQLNTVVARDLESLEQSGRFSYVRSYVEQKDGSLTLVYSVRPRLRLRAIAIVGAHKLSSRKIKNELGLEPGAYVDDALAGEKVRQLETYFRAKKYPDATATWTLVPDEARGAADLTIQVDEGEKLRVKQINLLGSRFLSDSFGAKTGRFFKRLVPRWSRSGLSEWFTTAEVSDQLNQNETWWFTSWFGAYQPELIDVDVAAITKYYMDRGFLDVAVTQPDVEPLGRGRIELTYRITEGVQYRVGAIELEGAELFDPADLKKQIRLKSGDVAAQSDIDAAAATIRRYYGNRGYIRSMATPVVQADATSRTADVAFRIQEGQQATINRINIRGNEKTKDEVLRRELAVFPGEAFNQQKVETSQNRLKNLGYLKSVNSSYAPSPAGTNTYDMTFDVEEDSMGSFLIGAGFSSVDSLVGFVELSHGNFDIKNWPPVGDGQKFNLRVQAGTSRSDVEISYEEPWFMDRKLALGVSLYYNDATYYSDYYSLKTTGGKLSLSKPLAPFIRGTVSYSLESFDVYDVATNAPPEIESEEGTYLKSTVGVSVSRDTRDQFYIPTRGNRTTATLEYSGGPLGGDTDITYAELSSSQYWPIGLDHVFSLRGRIRSVDATGDGDVPIFERLFLGGPRDLRGFEYRDIGPRSEDEDYSDESIGGRSSWFASAEYTVPLWNQIRGAVFYDAGAVGEKAFDFSGGGINSDFGIGARFDLPMFPLRLDYAFPHLKDEDNEDAQPRWNFMLGYTF